MVTNADDAGAPLPVTTPPARRRLVRRRPLDYNRPLQVLSVLLIYVIVVHYTIKFVAFFLPEKSLSREELLDAQGSMGVLGLPLEAPLKTRTGGSRAFPTNTSPFLPTHVPSSRYTT